MLLILKIQISKNIKILSKQDSKKIYKITCDNFFKHFFIFFIISESQITLKERVEYLTQAIVALNSTQKVSVKDEVSELNDKKDVALLQEKIYIELSQVEPRTDGIQDALSQWTFA